MLTKMKIGVTVLLAFGVLFAPRKSEASSITWLYAGSVTSTFNDSLVPLDTPASIVLSIDTTNIFEGACGPNVPQVGSYAFTADVSFLGLTYHATGYFEMNYDAFRCFPMPGAWQVQWRFGVTGPSLTGAPTDPISYLTSFAPSGYMFNFGNPGCFAGGGVTRCMDVPLGSYTYDPYSAAIPIFSSYGYRINFNGDCSSDYTCPGGGTVTVMGAAVPEPSTWLLMMSGLLAVAARRFAKRTQQ